jgi:hypothetical protein
MARNYSESARKISSDFWKIWKMQNFHENFKHWKILFYDNNNLSLLFEYIILMFKFF